MKEIVRQNIVNLPYSLHDGVVIKLEVLNDDRLLLQFEDGFINTAKPDELTNGKIMFERVDWDFSYAYVLEFPDEQCGNETNSNRVFNFTGKKMELLEFIKQYPSIRFEIIDETYGYNQSKFDGYLWGETTMKECRIEIYHLGDMKYIIED